MDHLPSDAGTELGPCQSCGQGGHQSLGMNCASQQLHSPSPESGCMGLNRGLARLVIEFGQLGS